MKANPMTEEMHKITITIDGVIVNLRSNGDGYEYDRIKDALRGVVWNCMRMTGTEINPTCGDITISDERIA